MSRGGNDTISLQSDTDPQTATLENSVPQILPVSIEKFIRHCRKCDFASSNPKKKLSPKKMTEHNHMKRFLWLEKLGEGSFGEVWKTKEKASNKLFAIKLSKFDDSEGIPATTLREMSELTGAAHPYVVALINVFMTDDKICLVMEYCDTDLSKFIKAAPARLIPHALVIKFTRQLIGAVCHCHSLHVVHRDIKPSNILVNTELEQIKIADFGLTRHTLMDDPSLLTPEVVTLWYRAPELLLGRTYDWTVDLWSIGCVVGEMALGRPLFPGDSEIDTIFRIFRCAYAPASFFALVEATTDVAIVMVFWQTFWHPD